MARTMEISEYLRKRAVNAHQPWVCVAASGPGRLAIIDGTMNPEFYQQVLKGNLRTSVCAPNLKRMWVIFLSAKEWLKKNKVNVLEWPC